MFGDSPDLPIMLVLLWTAMMFWAGLLWFVYAIFTNDQIKTSKAVELGVTDFAELRGEQFIQIQKLCRRRMTAPFRVWLEGLVYVAIFSFVMFVGK